MNQRGELINHWIQSDWISKLTFRPILNLIGSLYWSFQIPKSAVHGLCLLAMVNYEQTRIVVTDYLYNTICESHHYKDSPKS